MLIFNFNTQQRVALAELLMEVASYDGVISDIEKKYILDILNFMGLKPERTEQDPFNKLSQVFDSKVSRCSLLATLATLAHLDGDFHQKEVLFLNQLVESLALEQEEIERIDLWSRRQALQIREAYSLLK